MMRWYAAQTRPRLEKWARGNLWERGFEVYLPLYRRRRRHARKTDWVEAAFFPRYLFVRADLAAGARRAIASAPGIEHLVAFGERPAALADAVVEEIRAREQPDGLLRLGDVAGVRPGDRVRIEAGALIERTGIFEAHGDADRVFILLNLLGRPVRAQVAANDVRRLV